MRTLRKTGSRRKRDKKRVLICKTGPPEAFEQALMGCGRDCQVSSVDSLAEALSICMEDRVDSLVVNMFSFSSGELTSLMMFREMRPRQEVILLCGEDVATMLSMPGLATACYPVRTRSIQTAVVRRVRP